MRQLQQTRTVLFLNGSRQRALPFSNLRHDVRELMHLFIHHLALFQARR